MTTLKVYSHILDGYYSIPYLVSYFEESGKIDIVWTTENNKAITTNYIDYMVNNVKKFTELEIKIFVHLIGKKRSSTTSHNIAKYLGGYDSKGKQIIGMAIGRMKKKGIKANYGALK